MVINKGNKVGFFRSRSEVESLPNVPNVMDRAFSTDGRTLLGTFYGNDVLNKGSIVIDQFSILKYPVWITSTID